MSRTITAARVATLVGNLAGDERPLYLELAERLRLLIGEGRIPAATRLPSERELTDRPRRQPDDGDPGLRRAPGAGATPSRGVAPAP